MRELNVEAQVNQLERVRQFVAEEIEGNCSTEQGYEIDLIVEELFVNIAKYAYYPKEGRAVIRCRYQKPNDFYMEVEDEGHPFNPLDCKDPDINADINHRNIGKLGVYMVKHLVDEMSYVYKNGKNQLRIRKKMCNQ